MRATVITMGSPSVLPPVIELTLAVRAFQHREPGSADRLELTLAAVAAAEPDPGVELSRCMQACGLVLKGRTPASEDELSSAVTALCKSLRQPTRRQPDVRDTRGGAAAGWGSARVGFNGVAAACREEELI